MEFEFIRLSKGMTKDEVNRVSRDFILLEDDIFLGTGHRHNWRCLCGNIIEKRTWDTIRNCKSIRCKICKHKDIENEYKFKIEKCGEYEYIKAYFKGDLLPSGKVVDRSIYIQIKHKYCGSVYETTFGGFGQGKRCGKCCGAYEKSFAHHIIEELKLDINDVWNFEKNIVNPYHIRKSYGEKVFIKCQDKDYHNDNGGYEVSCANYYSKKSRCGYCNPNGGKIHKLDSFGTKYPDKAKCWHEDNEKNLYEVHSGSGKKFKFRCDACSNVWRATVGSISNGNWCPSCNEPKGERRVREHLLYRNIPYETQKKYDNLLGVGGGNLSYDFYLKDHNLLIEYQGEFHDGNVGCIQTDEDFKRQQEHDKRKKQYAIDNNIRLLEIWYWDFDNIEKIIDNYVLELLK